MRFLIRGFVCSILCWLAIFAGPAHAAPVVVVPGEGAGYMYFPQETTSGGSSGTTSVTVSVNGSPNVHPSVMTPEEAGTCETTSVIGAECEWGDSRKFKYAGTVGSKKLFAEAVSADPNLMWGCYCVLTGAISMSDGMSNTNIALSVNHAYNPCKNSGAEHPTIAHLFCQQKNMYIPAKDELQIIYNNRLSIGGFSTNNYWSSSENDNNNA